MSVAEATRRFDVEADPPTGPTPPSSPRARRVESNNEFHNYVFQHIFEEVLSLDKDCGLHIAIKQRGARDVHDLFDFSKTEIEDFTYKLDNREHKVLVVQKKAFMCLQALAHRKAILGDALLDTEDFMDLTRNEFIRFRQTDWLEIQNGESRGLHAPSTPSPPTSRHHNAKTPADEFRKGIKRDPKLFDTFSNDEHWDSYVRKMHTESRAQAVHEVIEPDYKPKTRDEIELFDEKKKYMMSVFFAYTKNH